MKYALVTAHDKNPLYTVKYKSKLKDFNVSNEIVFPSDEFGGEEEICYIEINTLEEINKLIDVIGRDVIIQKERYTKTNWSSQIEEYTIKIWDGYLD